MKSSVIQSTANLISTGILALMVQHSSLSAQDVPLAEIIAMPSHAVPTAEILGSPAADVPTAEILDPAPAHVPQAEVIQPGPPVMSRAAQAEAIRRHPELARAGSAFNREFLARVKRCIAENPALLQDAQWPVALADDVARAGFASIRFSSPRTPAPVEVLSMPTSPGLIRLVGRTAIPHPETPSVVQLATAAGNLLQTKPYKWGGGHGCTEDTGYDCSGSVSYVLKKAGLLDRSLTSSGFVSYGKPGPGRWITIYARSGHVFMTVGGLRLDTGGFRGRGESGPRWSPFARYNAGFVMRHPPGC